MRFRVGWGGAGFLVERISLFAGWRNHRFFVRPWVIAAANCRHRITPKNLSEVGDGDDASLAASDLIRSWRYYCT